MTSGMDTVALVGFGPRYGVCSVMSDVFHVTSGFCFKVSLSFITNAVICHKDKPAVNDSQIEFLNIFTYFFS